MGTQTELQLYRILDSRGYANLDLLGKIIKVVDRNSNPGQLIELMAARTAHTLSTIVGIYMIGELGKEPCDLTNREIEEYYHGAKDALEFLTVSQGKRLDNPDDERDYFPIVDGYMRNGFKGSRRRGAIIQHTDKRVTLHTEPDGAEWYEYRVMVKGKWQEYDPKIHGDLNFDLQGHFAPKLSTRSW
ncbi:hypothetical protein KBD69_03555 [Candidatus Woesebacteria bacterium]|nr:hypothetical protein [Candidatus Woesebacteria bacterium]